MHGPLLSGQSEISGDFARAMHGGELCIVPNVLESNDTGQCFKHFLLLRFGVNIRLFIYDLDVLIHIILIHLEDNITVEPLCTQVVNLNVHAEWPELHRVA